MGGGSLTTTVYPIPSNKLYSITNETVKNEINNVTYSYVTIDDSFSFNDLNYSDVDLISKYLIIYDDKTNYLSKFPINRFLQFSELRSHCKIYLETENATKEDIYIKLNNSYNLLLDNFPIYEFKSNIYEAEFDYILSKEFTKDDIIINSDNKIINFNFSYEPLYEEPTQEPTQEPTHEQSFAYYHNNENLIDSDVFVCSCGEVPPHNCLNLYNLNCSYFYYNCKLPEVVMVEDNYNKYVSFKIENISKYSQFIPRYCEIGSLGRNCEGMFYGASNIKDLIIYGLMTFNPKQKYHIDNITNMFMNSSIETIYLYDYGMYKSFINNKNKLGKPEINIEYFGDNNKIYTNYIKFTEYLPDYLYVSDINTGKIIDYYSLFVCGEIYFPKLDKSQTIGFDLNQYENVYNSLCNSDKIKFEQASNPLKYAIEYNVD